MAKCDEGYRCEVCGQDVSEIMESDLYLRYVIGQIEAEVLHTHPERHVRCNPTLAQFIVDDDFEPIEVKGAFDKRNLDPEHVQSQQTLVTRGWQRLVEIAKTEVAIIDYPLPEVLARNKSRDAWNS
tara:strand:- start:44 stop:421 length:378 start_codon:yes stop_codon:yes gene_type:complete